MSIEIMNAVLNELRMPEEYKGKYSKPGGGGKKTAPREWTEAEVNWCLDRFAEGYTAQRIADATDRSLPSVKMKLKRSSKEQGTYNDRDRERKYLANQAFGQLIQPQSVLDCYAGNSWWAQNYPTITNDIDEKYCTDFNMTARNITMLMELEGRQFDIVDLDPFGSAFDCFDSAIRIAKRGLVVSFGEWGHRRWRRFDFVRDRYGIEKDDEFTIENLVAGVKKVGRINKKNLTVVDSLKYRQFVRVYFSIERHKVTEQWGAER